MKFNLVENKGSKRFDDDSSNRKDRPNIEDMPYGFVFYLNNKDEVFYIDNEDLYKALFDQHIYRAPGLNEILDLTPPDRMDRFCVIYNDDGITKRIGVYSELLFKNLDDDDRFKFDMVTRGGCEILFDHHDCTGKTEIVIMDKSYVDNHNISVSTECGLTNKIRDMIKGFSWK